MSLSFNPVPMDGGDSRSGQRLGGNTYGRAPASAPRMPRSRTYRAQRPTLPDVPPAVVTAPGPAWLLLAVPVGLVPILLGFIGINRQMWIDEYVTYYVTRLTWSQFWHLMVNQDLVHGTYYTLMRLWTQLAGTSLVALRFPSLLGMAVTAAGLTLLGRRLFGTRVGLLAGLVFGVLPTVSRYGQEVRSYAMVSALVVVATLVLTYAIERPDGRRWTPYAVLAIVMVYLHAVSAIVLLPHALLVLHGWRRERDRALAWWLACAAAVVAAAVPLLLFAKGQSGQVDWITADSAAVRRYPAELFGSDVVAFALVALGLVGAARLARRRAGNMLAVLVWAVLPPVVCYLTFDVVHLFLATYVLYVLPAWALLIGGVIGVPAPESPPTPAFEAGTAPWAVPSRKRWLGRPAAIFLVLVPVVIAALAFPAHRELRRSPLAGEPDFRGAAAVVDRGFVTGDGVVYVGTYRWARIPFTYELRSATPKDVFAAGSPADNERLQPRDCGDPAACLGSTARVWLVVSNYSADDWIGLPEGQSKLLRRDFKVANKTPLDNVRVVLLVRT